MKKIIISTSLLALLFTDALQAGEPLKAKCIHVESQKFQNCEVIIQETTLEIKFKDEEHQGENKTISGTSVMKIASGEYAKRLMSESGSLVSGILLGPVNTIGRLVFPDEEYQQYILDYKNNQGTETATIINIPLSKAPEFQQELTLLTSQLINFQEGQTLTTIDIGPDIRKKQNIR